MAKIKLLSEDVINKISAGEVVERPKNVIKELVENSIDANSTKIIVSIKNGGRDYMSITDNGSGISKDDVRTAFLPHATSKIETDDDLYSVLSLGFRGEALSSICAVSTVTLTTKTDNDDTGKKITIEGQNVLEEIEVPFNTGTKIEVTNIFKNVPARLKFMKKASVESSYITEFMQKIALCYPQIAFKFVNNDTTILDTSGNGDIKEVFYKIYGKEVQNDLIEVAYKDNDISISGAICKGSSYRANRNYQSFFINNRIVRSDVLRKAVEDAYKGVLPIGKFPIFAIHIFVDPSSIDINVHPSKEEVRFSDDAFMYDLMYKVISENLHEIINIPKAIREPLEIEPEVKIIHNEKTEYITEKIKPYQTDFSSFYNGIEKAENLSLSDSIVEKVTPSNEYIDIVDVIDKIDYKHYHNNSVTKNVSLKENLYPNKFFNNVKIVGQIFNTYWIVEADNTSYIIDQHSAHEKILYEEFMHSFKNHNISTQILLMPISVILTEEESNVLNDNLELFTKFGFDIEIFGKNTYAIRSVPYVFESVNSPAFFLELLENVRMLGKNIDNMPEMYEEKIISMSCKSAVKANDNLSYKDATVIIEKLMKLENPFNCPHGRPTIVELTKTSIEKMFKRII